MRINEQGEAMAQRKKVTEKKEPAKKRATRKKVATRVSGRLRAPDTKRAESFQSQWADVCNVAKCTLQQRGWPGEVGPEWRPSDFIRTRAAGESVDDPFALTVWVAALDVELSLLAIDRPGPRERLIQAIANVANAIRDLETIAADSTVSAYLVSGANARAVAGLQDELRSYEAAYTPLRLAVLRQGLGENLERALELVEALKRSRPADVAILYASKHGGPKLQFEYRCAFPIDGADGICVEEICEFFGALPPPDKRTGDATKSRIKKTLEAKATQLRRLQERCLRAEADRMAGSIVSVE